MLFKDIPEAQLTEKPVENLFITEANDETMYKYEGRHWAALFTSKGLPGQHLENYRSFTVYLFEEKKNCPQHILIDLYADEDDVRKHQARILQTIESIRFDADDKVCKQ
jgi:hypothetical protein